MDANLQSVMKGGGFYNKYSGWQQAVQDEMYAHIIKSAQTCALPSLESGKPWRLADLGCSQGRNSMAPISAVLREVRARAPSLPASVLHTDLPDNDFSTLFHVVEGEGSYTRSFDDVYTSALGRSYYSRLVPSSELHMLLAFVTVHWLPKAPEWGPEAWNQWHPAATPAILDSCRKQASEAFCQFLDLRAAECVPGAKLILSMVGSDEHGVSGSPALITFVNEVLEELAAEGSISRSCLSEIALPVYCRREEDLRATLALPRVQANFSVEAVQLDYVRHPMELQHEAGEVGWEAVVDAVVGGVVAIWEPTILAPFHDADQRKVLQEELPRRLRAKVTPCEGNKGVGFSWQHLFCVLTRR